MRCTGYQIGGIGSMGPMTPGLFQEMDTILGNRPHIPALQSRPAEPVSGELRWTPRETGPHKTSPHVMQPLRRRRTEREARGNREDGQLCHSGRICSGERYSKVLRPPVQREAPGCFRIARCLSVGQVTYVWRRVSGITPLN